jgi:5-methyltetrahydrofolate--homocysteine methyltransferase
MPEQSTVAIVADHPQAVYFGMKSGFIPRTRRRTS